MTAQPVLLMIAGPNGSGKTTLTQQLRDEHVDLGVYINADDIALALTGSYDDRVAEAQRLAEARRQDCLNQRISFSFETVMSHPSKIDLLKQARTLGYFNVLYFVATESPAFNIAHVRQRVALGGHDVPEERIAARYTRTLALLPMRSCSAITLFSSIIRIATHGMRRSFLSPYAKYFAARIPQIANGHSELFRMKQRRCRSGQRRP